MKILKWFKEAWGGDWCRHHTHTTDWKENGTSPCGEEFYWTSIMTCCKCEFTRINEATTRRKERDILPDPRPW